TEKIVQKIALTGGALPDTGPGAPAAPLTQLTAMPGTDISAYLGDMQFNPTVKGPINFFDAIKITNPALWGSKGPNVAYVGKDALGFADFQNYRVLNVKNPSVGALGWNQIKNDVTPLMLPPGHVQTMGMSAGWDFSVTGINEAVAYTFCRRVNGGSQIAYHTTDLSK
ncbi:MAG: hypothetical protein JNJ88_18900, partial [Planctomycetes bacterium]|nr:hypothetical protein [Planctomycetota bacterium]